MLCNSIRTTIRARDHVATRLGWGLGVTAAALALTIGTARAGEDDPRPAAAPMTRAAPAATARSIGTVRVTAANVRSGPGKDFPVVRTVHHGARFTIEAHEGEWFRGHIEDVSKVGWVAGRYVTRDANAAHVDADALHVRTEPRLGAPILFRVFRGQPVTVHETQGDWIRIENGAQQTVYIYAELVETGGGAIATPAGGAPTATSGEPAPAAPTSATAAQLRRAELAIDGVTTLDDLLGIDLRAARRDAQAVLETATRPSELARAKNILERIRHYERLTRSYRNAVEPIEQFFEPLPPSPRTALDGKGETPARPGAAPRAAHTGAPSDAPARPVREAAPAMALPKPSAAPAEKP